MLVLCGTRVVTTGGGLVVTLTGGLVVTLCVGLVVTLTGALVVSICGATRLSGGLGSLFELVDGEKSPPSLESSLQ